MKKYIKASTNQNDRNYAYDLFTELGSFGKVNNYLFKLYAPILEEFRKVYPDADKVEKCSRWIKNEAGASITIPRSLYADNNKIANMVLNRAKDILSQYNPERGNKVQETLKFYVEGIETELSLFSGSSFFMIQLKPDYGLQLHLNTMRYEAARDRKAAKKQV